MIIRRSKRANGQVSDVRIKGNTWVNKLGEDGKFNTLDGWESAGTVSLDSTKKLVGNNSVKIVATGTVCRTLKTYSNTLASQYYVAIISVFIESRVSGSAGLRIYDYDSLTNQIVTNADVSKIGVWQPLVVKFRKTGFQFYVGGTNFTGTCYFDAGRVYEVSETEYNTVGNEATIAQKYHYVDNVKSTNSVRIRSVNEDETKESIAYVNLPPGEVLRSLPNGTKDEVRVSEGKCYKRVSDEIVVTGSDIYSMNARTYVKDVVFIFPDAVRFNSSLGQANVFGRNEVSAENRDLVSSIGSFYVNVAIGQENKYIRLLFDVNMTDQQIIDNLNQYPITLIYQLAEPIVTQHEVVIVDQDGNPRPYLEAYPGGSFNVEVPTDGSSTMPDVEYTIRPKYSTGDMSVGMF